MRVTWLALEWPRAKHHSGGVGRYTERLARQTAELVELTVVTYEGAEQVPGIRYLYLPTPRGRITRYYTSAWRARAAVAASKPDIIHAHGDDFLLSASAPIIRTFYGSSYSEAWASSGLRRLNHFVLGALEWWSARRAVARLGIAPETIDLFNCEELFPPFLGSLPVAARRPAARPTVVFIGSFHGRKQGWLAQKAVAGLRAYAHPSAQLVVIGPREDAPQWASWVEHRSGLSDTEVSAILSTAWLLASPSSYEGFGIPVAEALAHDVPVIALNNPGSLYIRSQGDLNVPLHLAADAGQFIDAVSEQIAQGPYNSPKASASAKSVVSKLTYAGSPERLVGLYKKFTSAKDIKK